MDSNKKKEANKQLMRYAGMGAQFIAGIGIALFIGMKADAWIGMSFPLLVWLFPLLIIVGVIIKTVVETGHKN